METLERLLDERALKKAKEDLRLLLTRDAVAEGFFSDIVSFRGKAILTDKDGRRFEVSIELATEQPQRRYAPPYT
jgi:hypothetical protein